MWFTAAPVWTVKKVYIRETKEKLGEHIKQHTADTASNQSVIHEYYKLTGHHLDKDKCHCSVSGGKNCSQESKRGNLYQERTWPHPK